MKWKNVLLIMVVCGVVASLLGPTVLAAPKGASAKEASLLDPFTLRTVSMAGDTEAVDADTKVTLTRQDIRIPFRPGLRSAFKPVW